MKLSLEFEGLEGARKGLAAGQRLIGTAMGRAVRKGTNAATRSVRKAAPRRSGKGPHRVRAGVRSRVTGRGIDTVGRVYLSGVARIVAHGAQPHSIAPKNKRALKFRDGQFAASAESPGSAPNPFFGKGVDDAMPVIEKELDLASGDIVDIVVKNIDKDRKGL